MQLRNDKLNGIMGIVFFLCVFCVALFTMKDHYKAKINQINISHEYKISQIQHQLKAYKKAVETYENTLKSSQPFVYCAKLCSELSTLIYDNIAYELVHKYHPARKAAEEIRKCKAQIKHLEAANREFVYKYEYLTSVFPELEEYIGDDEALLHLSKESSLNSFLNDYDRTRNYISKEEWELMPENKRNQLAFDRWKQQPKSKWTIGMLYEMYIANKLRSGSFIVYDFGIREGVCDLGRDIIAKRHTTDGYNVYIIQCKNWSLVKEVHENVICQLYGTTLEYQISHREPHLKHVIPVLVTTTKLSSMAEKFAKKLGVVVKIIAFDINDMPLIKCNINNGNKIYHLPFDQQYWSTIIDKEGEFYAWTVEEAYQKGFRRAYRWNGKV